MVVYRFCFVYDFRADSHRMTDSKIEHGCETEGCKSPATLQCPVCLKMGIQGSFFCSQACFKGSWKAHKVIHLLASEYLLRWNRVPK